MKIQTLNTTTLFASLFLALIIALYLFTPTFDEWVIEKSLKRFCELQKRDFQGEMFSPAYLCTFIEGVE